MKQHEEDVVKGSAAWAGGVVMELRSLTTWHSTALFWKKSENHLWARAEHPLLDGLIETWEDAFKKIIITIFI